MAKIRICKEKGCNNSQTTEGYCRLHYLKNWKKLKSKRHKTAAERLNKYIEQIVERNPNRYMEVLKKDIRSPHFEKNFIDESGSDMDDLYRIFNDPGYEADVEKLIKDIKTENKF